MDMSTSKPARNEVEWRERMARFAASGQTVKQLLRALIRSYTLPLAVS